MNSYREYTLDNGLRVALQHFPSKNIRGKLRINFGAYHENPGEEGLAHFVEHGVSFGGSRKFSPREVADRIEDFGSFDHTTSLGRTTYDYFFPGEDLNEWLDFVSDIVFFPRFDEGIIESERRAIVREITDHKSNPNFSRSRLTSETFYRDHPKKRWPGGEVDVIADSGLADLRRLHSRGYNADSSDLILVGNLPGDIGELVEKSFRNIPEGADNRVDFPELPTLDKREILHFATNERVNLDNPEESSAEISLYFVCPPTESEDSYPFCLLDRIIGRDSRSRLFRRLRVREGLAYSIYSFGDTDYNAGLFGIMAKVPVKSINLSMSIINDEFDRLKKEGVTDQELEKARRKFLFNITTYFDSIEGMLELAEHRLDYGVTVDEAIERYHAVTVDDIGDAARKYLTENYVLVIGDPLKK